MDREAATLNDLEGAAPAPTFDSYLVSTIHRLRSKAIGQFTVEDLRICIGQGVGLRWLLPEAAAVLRQAPLAEGDFYPGDLLVAVLGVGSDAWATHPGLRAQVGRAAREAAKQMREKAEADPTLAKIEEHLRLKVASFSSEAGEHEDRARE
jgi:hypothetical protein